MFCQRLERGEPDRPPLSQQVQVGRSLRHRRFGFGLVVEVLNHAGESSAVRIDFGPRHGTQCIALDRGLLRPASWVPRGGGFHWFIGR